VSTKVPEASTSRSCLALLADENEWLGNVGKVGNGRICRIRPFCQVGRIKGQFLYAAQAKVHSAGPGSFPPLPATTLASKSRATKVGRIKYIAGYVMEHLLKSSFSVFVPLLCTHNKPGCEKEDVASQRVQSYRCTW
jgi:hypothetical protein